MKKVNAVIIGLISIFMFGAVSINAATLTVTKAANSNDGVCNADCSLREAVAVSNSGDLIVFNPNLVGQTFTLGGSAISFSGKRIEIDGNLDGTNVVFLSGSNTNHHFNVGAINAVTGLTLRNMILVNGKGNLAGSLQINDVSLILDRVAIRGNTGLNAGAIYTLNNATTIITNSSITGNTSTSENGYQIAAILGQTLYMSNTTVSNNRSLGTPNPDYDAGTIYGLRVYVRNCTVTENQGIRGGGFTVTGGAGSFLDVGNSIIAGNTSVFGGQDIEFIFGGMAENIISRGGNLIGNTANLPAGIFNQPNDAVNLNPLLAPTNSNQGGHPVFTHPLQAGSPAINTGINSLAVNPQGNIALQTDGRGTGFPRISGGTVDKGAFEDQTNGATLIVSKLANGNDGVCDIDCSLREAVAAANNDAGTDNIIFAANVFGTLDLGGSEILIQNNDVNIIGYPSLTAETLIASGNNANRIFRINNSDVSITGMTLANGNGIGAVSSGFGGAIYAYGGANLTLNRVIVRSNSANVYGAVYLLGGTHRINNSTINNNRATNCIAVGNVNGTLNMANATISTNLDSDSGSGAGALCNIGATANIRNSTIAFNRIGNDPGAGIWSNGTLNIGNSIVSNNIAGSNPDINNVSGTVNSLGGNLVQNPSGFSLSAINAESDQINVDPMLAVLSNNGGNVPTLLLQANSPAINGGLNSVAVDPFDNSILASDARGEGFLRIVSTVDKGAFETLIPTAGTTTISGRVLNGKSGVPNAQVYILGQNGIMKTATTNSLGFYRFDEIEVGQTYVVSATSKLFQFESKVISVLQEVLDADFIAD